MKVIKALDRASARHRQKLLYLAGLAAALAGAVPGDTRAEPLGNEVMIVNVKTNKCLTIAGGVSPANNVRALQFECDADASRRWTIRLKL